jgi:predicted dehydrogenase
MVRFGIVGFGHFAVKRLMPNFARAQRSRVTAISRRELERAQNSARQFGIAHAFSSTAELCACPDVDAVLVTSPDAMHHSDALVAIQHNKPVLVEKPMAMNGRETASMVQAAREAGVLLGVAHNMRFERSVEWFRQQISAGTIGRPLLARAAFVVPMLTSPRTWAQDPKLATGGPLADIGVHCIDTLRYVLADEVESVTVQAHYDSQSRLEASACATLRFSHGTLAEVAVSGRGAYHTFLEVVGETGTLSAVNALTVDHPVTLELRRGLEIAERADVSNHDAYTLQLDAFAEAVEEGKSFLTSGEDGLRNQLILDAAFRSMKSGRTETVQLASSVVS